MRKLIALIGLCLVSSVASATDLKIKIKKQYINFPVSQKAGRKTMSFLLNGELQCKSDIRLSDKPEYWVFQDVSLWKGKTLVMSGDFDEAALSMVYQADTIMGESEIYHEAQRPQYHFSTRRGWINDPNGLVWDNGFHMFYQHNPYEKEWGNMHWGHAVSDDMLHWKELPLALHPDSIGTVFSGTVVSALDEETGFEDRKAGSPLIAFYTADGRWQTQCMAYSYDHGLTWTKYDANPVVDSHEKWQSHDTRDPKVFRYADGDCWVMVVNERNGNTIYNSKDLRHWTPQSHITGFWECPELFELQVGEECHWVMWGASGTYMIGRFDGKTFTPETNKLQNCFGLAYAAQTFSELAERDGRRVKMAWARINFDGMPFNGCMLLPQEQTLKRTKQGLRLYSRPVKEVESLMSNEYKGSDLSAKQANDILAGYKDNDQIRIKATLHLTYSTDAGISFRGQRILDYDLNGNRVNGNFYSPEEPGSMDISAEIYIDRSIAEVYIDGGALSYSMKLDGREDKGYEFWGNQVQIKSLEIDKVASIW